MAHSKFSLDGGALEESTRQLIQPDHVMLLEEEAGVHTHLSPTPPGLPPPRENHGEPGDAPENSLLKCIMEDACDHLHAFQEYEHYSFVNSEPDCDVPEDEFTDDMENIFSDEDQLVPESLEEEEGPIEEDHGQQSAGNIPMDDTIAIEGNIEPSVENLDVTLVDVQVTEPDHEDPSTLRHRDEMEDIIAVEEDQLVPVNSPEAEHFTEGDHDQPSPIVIPVEGILAIEGNETSPANLYARLVNVQGTEPEDPSTQKRLDFNNAAFDSAYPEADQEVTPDMQLDVKVQTVASTSAAEGESNSSNWFSWIFTWTLSPLNLRTVMNQPLHEAVNGDSTASKDVDETPLKRAIEAGAPED